MTLHPGASHIQYPRHVPGRNLGSVRFALNEVWSWAQAILIGPGTGLSVIPGNVRSRYLPHAVLANSLPIPAWVAIRRLDDHKYIIDDQCARKHYA